MPVTPKSQIFTPEITVSSLAELLRRDIRQRNLRTGDPYMSTAEAAKFLGVSTFLANRTLQLLQKQSVLVRSQRRGAIITSPFADAQSRAVPTRIKLLLGEDIFRHHPSFYEEIINGLQAILKISRPEQHKLSAREESKIVDDLIAEILATREHVGLVLAGAPLHAQRHVANSGLPAIVLGTVFPSVTNLPSLDQDFFGVMEEIVLLFRRKKCRRYAVFFLNRMYPGNHLLLRALGIAMQKQGLNLRQLTIRCLPFDHDVCRAEARRLLESGEKVGFICHLPLFAEAVEDAYKSATKKTKPEICISNALLDPEGSRKFHRIEISMEPTEIGKQLGRQFLNAGRSAISLGIPTHLASPKS